MTRLAILTLFIILAAGACRGERASVTTARTDDSVLASAETTSLDRGWDPAALVKARDLATAVAVGGVVCGDHSPSDHVEIAASYGKRLPVPAAMTTCVGPADEDITFEVFADEDARDDFVASKLYVICRAAQKKGLRMPELNYVEGPDWLIEPDEPATADRLASILGGESKRQTCPEANVASASAVR